MDTPTPCVDKQVCAYISSQCMAAEGYIRNTTPHAYVDPIGFLGWCLLIPLCILLMLTPPLASMGRQGMAIWMGAWLLHATWIWIRPHRIPRSARARAIVRGDIHGWLPHQAIMVSLVYAQPHLRTWSRPLRGMSYLMGAMTIALIPGVLLITTIQWIYPAMPLHATWARWIPIACLWIWTLREGLRQPLRKARVYAGIHIAILLWLTIDIAHSPTHHTAIAWWISMGLWLAIAVPTTQCTHLSTPGGIPDAYFDAWRARYHLPRYPYPRFLLESAYTRFMHTMKRRLYPLHTLAELLTISTISDPASP